MAIIHECSLMGRAISAALVERNLSTFAHENYLLLPGGPKKLGLPLKSSVDGMLDGQLLVTLDEDWTPEGQSTNISQGSVVALDLAAAEKGPGAAEADGGVCPHLTGV